MYVISTEVQKVLLELIELSNQAEQVLAQTLSPSLTGIESRRPIGEDDLYDPDLPSGVKLAAQPKLLFEDSVAERLREHNAESPISGHPHNADRAKIVHILNVLELPTDDNYIVHFTAFVQAQRIYVDRYPSYLDEPIRHMGIKGVLVQARTCLERVWTRTFVSQVGAKHFKADDAYDGINYLAHFITQSYLKNKGTWDWGE